MKGQQRLVQIIAGMAFGLFLVFIFRLLGG